MKHFLVECALITQSLRLVFTMLFLFILADTVQARGYGSGDGAGQNHNYYIPIAEARFFMIYDVNRDGYLDPSEVAEMSMPISTFNQTDSNKNGKLDKGEFARMWASPPK